MRQWAEIPGYKYRYRISREGVIQKQMEDGSWLTLKPGLYHGSERATVQMVHMDGKPRPKGVVMLMADAFMGGRRPGTWIIHRNGLRLDNRLENLEVITPKVRHLRKAEARGEDRPAGRCGGELPVRCGGGQEEPCRAVLCYGAVPRGGTAQERIRHAGRIHLPV